MVIVTQYTSFGAKILNILARECFSLLVYNNTPCDADGC